MYKFWSDSEDFIFAGDGRILGGYKEWTDDMSQFTEITNRFPYWENKNIKIEVLSRNAASYTMEFDNGRIGVTGDTLHTKGAWTYVFRRDKGDWRVIQTNGTPKNIKHDLLLCSRKVSLNASAYGYSTVVQH